MDEVIFTTITSIIILSFPFNVDEIEKFATERIGRKKISGKARCSIFGSDENTVAKFGEKRLSKRAATE